MTKKEWSQVQDISVGVWFGEIKGGRQSRLGNQENREKLPWKSKGSAGLISVEKI